MVNREESTRIQVAEAIQEMKLEELAGCLLALHQLQNQVNLGYSQDSSALAKAKEITKQAVNAYQDLKELTENPEEYQLNNLSDKDLDFSWLDNISDEDWEDL